MLNENIKNLRKNKGYTQEELGDLIGVKGRIQSREYTNSEDEKKHIIEVVAEHFGVKKEDITSSRRNSEFVLPRQVFMYLCREMTDVSYANVAKMLGKKDHTTIIHGVNKIVEELEMNDELRTKIEVIKKKVSP